MAGAGTPIVLLAIPGVGLIIADGAVKLPIGVICPNLLCRRLGAISGGSFGVIIIVIITAFVVAASIAGVLVRRTFVFGSEGRDLLVRLGLPFAVSLESVHVGLDFSAEGRRTGEFVTYPFRLDLINEL